MLKHQRASVGSGCTTFLKTIANQRFGYTNVAGEVLYGPFTDKEFKQYRGEVVYNQEDDVHHATLVCLPRTSHMGGGLPRPPFLLQKCY